MHTSRACISHAAWCSPKQLLQPIVKPSDCPYCHTAGLQSDSEQSARARCLNGVHFNVLTGQHIASLPLKIVSHIAPSYLVDKEHAPHTEHRSVLPHKGRAQRWQTKHHGW